VVSQKKVGSERSQSGRRAHKREAGGCHTSQQGGARRKQVAAGPSLCGSSRLRCQDVGDLKAGALVSAPHTTRSDNTCGPQQNEKMRNAEMIVQER
jgi:hypothetical protein